MAELTIKHKPFQKAIQLLGVQSAETIEREIFKVVSAGTQVYYPGTVTSRVGMATTDVPTDALLSKVVANLRNLGAMGLEKAENGKDPELGDLFVGVVDTFIEQDISTTSGFVDATKYSAATRLWNGEIGKWKGVRWLRSNLIPTLTSAAAASTADNSADTGTITFNKSVRVMVTGTDSNGYERVIYQSSEVDTANDADTAHTISVTLPATTGFTYSIYASAALTKNSTTTSTAMTLQGSGFAPAAVIKIGSSSGSASSSRLQLTTTGAAAPAQLNAAGSKCHLSFVIGKEAYTCVDLMSLQATLTPNVASDSDPLKQRRKAGWKSMFKAVINNSDFIARFESESVFD